MSDPLPERDAGFYRRLRFRITATAAGLFVFLFVYFYFWDGVARVEPRHAFLYYALPSLLVGIAVAFLTGRSAEKYVRSLTTRLEKALETARVREQERDLAQEELVRKLQEERELAREKMQFEAQLAEYEKYAALAQLALGAAHEINNPLLGILSHLELELREKPDPDERAEIEQCIEGAKRISSTIRGLLNYTRPEPVLLSKISVDKLVSDTLNFLSHQPMFRGIRLEKKIPADLPAVSADSNQLSQVMTNLLLNAAQATPEGGSITIAADKVKFADNIEIRVTDTGAGIPADILPHVFEPFFTTKRGKGTGLGLSISQAYIRSHGGDILVESVPQRGTTVRIIMPIRQEGRPTPTTEEVVV